MGPNAMEGGGDRMVYYLDSHQDFRLFGQFLEPEDSISKVEMSRLELHGSIHSSKHLIRRRTLSKQISSWTRKFAIQYSKSRLSVNCLCIVNDSPQRRGVTTKMSHDRLYWLWVIGGSGTVSVST